MALIELADLRRAMTVPAVARLIHRDKATVHAWIKEGIRGVKLDAFFVGGQRYVLPEAVEAFVAALNDDHNSGPEKDDSELQAAAFEAQFDELLG